MKKSLFLLACLFVMVGCTPSNASPTPPAPPKPAPQKLKPMAKLPAKLSEATRTFFAGSLAEVSSPEPVAPEHKLKLSELEAYRNAMWQLWRESNKAFSEEKLPALALISETMPSHVWNLPNEEDGGQSFPARMPFYYGYKGARPSAGYPLFLYLHGSGDKGPEWENGRRFAGQFKDGPSIYFVPQIPNEGQLYRWWQRSKLHAWEKLLRLALLSDEVDPLRIYFFGISEGGYGSQRLASYYADYLAGAGPMAGGEPLINAPVENCQHIAFSLRTGSKDNMFHRDRLTQITKDAFEAQQARYPGYYKHFIQLISGSGHGIPYEPTTPWLAQHKRTPHPKSVRWEDYPVDGVYRQGFYNLQPLETPEDIERFFYDEEIAGNTINLKISSVTYTSVENSPQWGFPMRYEKTFTPATSGKIRVYLSPELVDLSKPVRILINGREVYSAQPTLSWKVMAESCTTFFDPQRLFPVALDLSY